MFHLDRIVQLLNIVQMQRSTASADTTSGAQSPAGSTEAPAGTEDGRAKRPRTTATKAAIIADFRASMGEIKCLASERLVRAGISMAQLHVLNLVESHGEMPMSRLADMLGVSLSNATGLIDRVEERGFVERTRVPTDRRMVLVRLTPAGRETVEQLEIIREQVLLRVLDQLDPAQLAGVAAAMVDLREAVVATSSAPGSEAHEHAHISPGRD